MKVGSIFSLMTAGACVGMSYAFAPPAGTTAFTRSSSASTIEGKVPLLMAKGFGDDKPKRKQKSEGQVDREQKAEKYDEIAGAGGQEYNVFVRQFGSDDDSWLPCGAIAVPRTAQVSDAVFANEEGLQKAIVRTYPKLQGYETEFEYGYNLKVYPDDPVEIAVKGGAKIAGPSVGNWISNLLSPIDASKVPPPPIEE